MTKKHEKIETNMKEKRKNSSFAEHSLDETDLKILKFLAANARASFREIANSVGIAPATAIERVRKLRDLGILQGFTIKLNHEKLGYKLSVAIELVVRKGKLLEVERKIAHHPNVCAVYDITGETDALIIAKFKDREELDAFVKSLLRIPLVERTNTHLILNTVKEDFTLI